MPAIEAMLTILPFEAIRCGMAAFIATNGPRTLTAKILSKLSVDCWSRGEEISIPALLTRTSRPPRMSTACWTAACIWPSSVTSQLATPAAPISSADCLAVSGLMSLTTTRAPRSVNSAAIALPIPAPDPVTKTRLPRVRTFAFLSHSVDLGHDFFLQTLEVVERLRYRNVLERRPEQRHRHPGFPVALEYVGDLRGASRQQVGALAHRRLIHGLVGDDEPDHAHDLEVVDRTGGVQRLKLAPNFTAPFLDVFRGVLDADPACHPVLRYPARRALRVLEPAEEHRRGRLLQRLRAEPAALEIGELTVVFEDIVRPDSLHDLDRLTHVLVPLRVDVRHACRREFLGHPARSDGNIEPAVRQVVDGCQLRGEDAGRAERRVDDAHADPDLRRLGREPGDQRHSLQE